MKIKMDGTKIIIEFSEAFMAKAFINWFGPERKAKFKKWAALMGDIIR